MYLKKIVLAVFFFMVHEVISSDGFKFTMKRGYCVPKWRLFNGKMKGSHSKKFLNFLPVGQHITGKKVAIHYPGLCSHLFLKYKVEDDDLENKASKELLDKSILSVIPRSFLANKRLIRNNFHLFKSSLKVMHYCKYMTFVNNILEHILSDGRSLKKLLKLNVRTRFQDYEKDKIILPFEFFIYKKLSGLDHNDNHERIEDQTMNKLLDRLVSLESDFSNSEKKFLFKKKINKAIAFKNLCELYIFYCTLSEKYKLSEESKKFEKIVDKIAFLIKNSLLEREFESIPYKIFSDVLTIKIFSRKHILSGFSGLIKKIFDSSSYFKEKFLFDESLNLQTIRKKITTILSSCENEIKDDQEAKRIYGKIKKIKILIPKH